MQRIEQAIENNLQHIEWMLVLSIGLFVLSALILLFLLFRSRVRRIRLAKREKRFTPYIDKVLFSVLFDDKSVSEVLASNAFRVHRKDRFFNKLLLRSIVKLHKEYKGDYCQKLELLFQESELIQFSLHKLEKGNWSARCEAIRDLSQLNVKSAYPKILEQVSSNHQTLKLEALLGIVKMKGLQSLSDLDQHNFDINDWIQANVIQHLDENHQIEAEQLAVLLKSANPSIVLLGIRLARHHRQQELTEALEVLQTRNESEKIRSEINHTLSTFAQV